MDHGRITTQVAARAVHVSLRTLQENKATEGAAENLADVLRHMVTRLEERAVEAAQLRTRWSSPPRLKVRWRRRPGGLGRSARAGSRALGF